jgi:hypothetical protein
MLSKHEILFMFDRVVGIPAVAAGHLPGIE